jgi:hypothetical protein
VSPVASGGGLGVAGCLAARSALVRFFARKLFRCLAGRVAGVAMSFVSGMLARDRFWDRLGRRAPGVFGFSAARTTTPLRSLRWVEALPSGRGAKRREMSVFVVKNAV